MLNRITGAQASVASEDEESAKVDNKNKSLYTNN